MIDTTVVLGRELAVAEEAARAAGAYLLRHLGKAQVKTYKAERDALLDVDLGAEKIVLEAIQAAFSDDAILSEESGTPASNARRLWIVDPLDGSYNFQHGRSDFGPAIALQVDGITQLGVLYLPKFGEMYTAVKGHGAFCNGEPLHTSDVATLSEGVVSVSDFAKTGNPEDNHEEVRIITALASQAGRVRLLGTAVDDFASLARGRSDGLVMYSLHPWDVEGGKLLVEEAGGIVTRVRMPSGQEAYVGGNRHIHAALTTLVAGQAV